MSFDDIETFVRALLSRKLVLLAVVLIAAIGIPLLLSYLSDTPEPAYLYLDTESR